MNDSYDLCKKVPVWYVLLHGSLDIFHCFVLHISSGSLFFLFFTGIKPYKCLFCQKAFSRRAHMVEHQQSHTDNYRFRCSTCNKGFTRQSYYRDHKCPTGGDGTGAAGQTGEAEEDEDIGAPAREEKDGEDDGPRRGSIRTVNGLGTDGEDREKDGTTTSISGHEGLHGDVQDEQEQEAEDGRTDEGCQAALSIGRAEGQVK